MPIGAEASTGGVHFRVWAPGHASVDVVSAGTAFRLVEEQNGYFSALISELAAGDTYRLRIKGDEYPDPASRFQPEGPHGPSQIVDAEKYPWSDGSWRGVSLEKAVIYELHVGTFTPEGSWRSATERLPHLHDLGVTVVELMPVADFSGKFGWGYDGVNMFAPTRLYGTPDEMRNFVDVAHSLGMAAVLDVVYNHFGADGNYACKFASGYVSQKYTTDWGDAIDFDGPDSGPVREFFISNAGYWIREFHLDGLRIDATQNIYDDSEPHILSEITARVRQAAGNRTTLVMAENEPQHTRLVRGPANGGFGMDALWNDDLHHTAVVAMTGHNDAYYTDYTGSPQEFVSAMKYGYLYQGQWYKWQSGRRGSSSLGLAPSAFVTFIENHDQVANSARGLRMHKQTTPGLLKAMTALILIGPGTPLLFQGQEFASSRPFLYFADMPENLAPLVREGRRDFMTQWRTGSMPDMVRCLEDPCSAVTFEKCKPDFSEKEANGEIYQLHRELLRMRREDPVLSSWQRGNYDGAVLGSHAFLLRAFREDHGDRLLLVNLGADLHLHPAPEPLLAAPDGFDWELMFSTEDPARGGCGTPPTDTADNWRIQGHSTIVMRSVPEKLRRAKTAGTETKPVKGKNL